MQIRLAQFGVGPIGLECLKLAALKPWITIVGAVDIDPCKIGCSLETLTGDPSLVKTYIHGSVEELLAHNRPDVVLHSSVSKLATALTQLGPLVDRGINVVSSCEELVFPQLREPQLAAEFDALCQQKGARVVGAGVNPGFVMDLLPAFLTAVSCDVRSILIERVVNASTRRQPLQRKIGSGMPPADFGAALRAGRAGHAGLRESLALLAHTLAWQIGPPSESAEVLMAERPIRTQFFEVLPGQTCGIHQRVEAQTSDGRSLTLDLRMALDADPAYDAVTLNGSPPLQLRIANGVAGDQATVGALINTIPRLLAAPPGLRLLTELPMPHWC